MLICAQCGEHNAADARFCGACNAFLEWDGARADEAPVATAVAEPAPATVAQPGEAGPAPVRHRSQTQAAPPRPPAPGDLICGQCGEGNAPTRRFCRRCGGSLADSLAVKPPWWRRFVPHRKDKRLQAGARRARRRGVFSESFRSAVRWVRNIVAIVVVLAAIGYALFPAFRHTVNTDATAARNKVVGMFVTHYDPVHPVTITANVSDPAHPADLVDDNTIGTYWAAPFNGPEPTLVLTFDHKVNLAKAIVRSGIGSDFQSADRPQTLHLVFSTGKTYDMNLADTPDPQDVSIGDSDGATSVEVHVTSRYHSLHGSEVAIDEFELFVKS
jgi:hypothetical protein